MASRNEDDLAPSKTDGFKVGEKKTLDEYAKLGMSLCHPRPCDNLPLLFKRDVHVMYYTAYLTQLHVLSPGPVAERGNIESLLPEAFRLP